MVIPFQAVEVYLDNVVPADSKYCLFKDLNLNRTLERFIISLKYRVNWHQIPDDITSIYVSIS